jgi:hypothetical protein
MDSQIGDVRRGGRRIRHGTLVIGPSRRAASKPGRFGNRGRGKHVEVAGGWRWIKRHTWVVYRGFTWRSLVAFPCGDGFPFCYFGRQASTALTVEEVRVLIVAASP